MSAANKLEMHSKQMRIDHRCLRQARQGKTLVRPCDMNAVTRMDVGSGRQARMD